MSSPTCAHTARCAGDEFGHAVRTAAAKAKAKAKAGMPTARPSFTAIFWGCGMALWPRMLQHVHSHVDGDVSVAALRMPAEAEPFVAAILAICAPPLVGHSARPLALPSASADGA